MLPDLTRAGRAAEHVGNHVLLPFTGGLGAGACVRRTVAQACKDRLPVHAGNVAYHALFALVPSLLALLWLLRLLHGGRLVLALLEVTDQSLPHPAAALLRAQVESAPDDQARGALSAGAVICVLLSVWALSATFRAVMEALNAMYAVADRRSAPRRYGLSVLLALGVAALLTGALGLVLLGNAAGERLARATGTGLGLRVAWTLATWPAVALGVLVAFGLVYYFAPDVEQRWRWVSPGAVAAVVGWVLFAGLFSLYIDRFARIDQTYGVLAGFVILMSYLYGSTCILLLGAEVNQIIELRQPDGKNEGDHAPSDGGRPLPARR